MNTTTIKSQACNFSFLWCLLLFLCASVLQLQCSVLQLLCYPNVFPQISQKKLMYTLHCREGNLSLSAFNCNWIALVLGTQTIWELWDCMDEIEKKGFYFLSCTEKSHSSTVLHKYTIYSAQYSHRLYKIRQCRVIRLIPLNAMYYIVSVFCRIGLIFYLNPFPRYPILLFKHG